MAGEVALDRRSGGRAVDGVVIHRPTARTGLEPVVRDRIPVTRPHRLLVDLGATRPAADVEAVLDHLVVRGTVTVAGVRAALARDGGRGRRGAGVLRSVLDRWAVGAVVPDSTREADMARWLAGAGGEEPAVHHRVGRYALDFAWPELLVGLEVDGWEVHGRREAFEADRLRDLHLQSLGWLVLHVSARSVMCRSPTVLRQVGEVLRRRSAA